MHENKYSTCKFMFCSLQYSIGKYKEYLIWLTSLFTCFEKTLLRQKQINLSRLVSTH